MDISVGVDGRWDFPKRISSFCHVGILESIKSQALKRHPPWGCLQSYPPSQTALAHAPNTSRIIDLGPETLNWKVQCRTEKYRNMMILTNDEKYVGFWNFDLDILDSFPNRLSLMHGNCWCPGGWTRGLSQTHAMSRANLRVPNTATGYYWIVGRWAQGSWFYQSFTTPIVQLPSDANSYSKAHPDYDNYVPCSWM